MPEVVALPVVEGSPNYLNWLDGRIGRYRNMRMAPGIALIFDMDGVIVDSNPLHRESWLLYNRRFGIETDEAMQQRMYGKRNDEIVRDFFGETLTDEQVIAHGAAKESLYREIMATSALRISGAWRDANFCSYETEHRWVSATNAERANVDFVLDGVNLGGAPLRACFQAVVDGQQVRRPKPAPDIYLRVAELLGVDAAKQHRVRGFPHGRGSRPGGRRAGRRRAHYTQGIQEYRALLSMISVVRNWKNGWRRKSR